MMYIQTLVYPQNLLLQAVGWCMFMLINKRDCIFLNKKTLILLSTTVILSLIIYTMKVNGQSLSNWWTEEQSSIPYQSNLILSI